LRPERGLALQAAGGGQLDLDRRLLLDPVAVHVDGLEDALGEVVLLRRRSFGTRKLRKVESFSRSTLA
jgi:hypothetical protein